MGSEEARVTVLLVHPDGGRAPIKETLSEGAHVVDVGSVAEARAWLGGNAADMVIVDFDLAQEVEGRDLFIALAGRCPNTARAVIVRGEVSLRALDGFPAHVVFPRPLDLTQLRDLVRSMIAPAPRRRQRRRIPTYVPSPAF